MKKLSPMTYQQLWCISKDPDSTYDAKEADRFFKEAHMVDTNRAAIYWDKVLTRLDSIRGYHIDTQMVVDIGNAAVMTSKLYVELESFEGITTQAMSIEGVGCIVTTTTSRGDVSSVFVPGVFVAHYDDDSRKGAYLRKIGV